SKGGSFPCFEEINSRGDRFGNCGSGYCYFHNNLCGKLVCTWPFRELVSHPNLSVIYAHVRDETCVSAYLPIPNTVNEESQETFVADGSMCGPDMYCSNKECKEVRFLVNTTLCENTMNCNKHGICNNFNHCHCDKGFAPPDCSEKKGAFGSIDDGHQHKTGSYL
ncbi:putative disintegrin and metalloproteinase domain-containing protein 5, partial [Otolemur garnettii]|uniref:putative disintegrin and metalloproteinase domain-containing protein 5 n=1 Tax=Otolemur garnettii TaxID=30611 RepID=UPI0006441CBB